MDETIKTILKSIVSVLQDHAWYFNGNGIRMPMLITNRYREGAISGVVFGNVSGGIFIADDIAPGPQPHGTPYWTPTIDPICLESLELQPETFGEELTIGLERKAVIPSSR